MFAREQREQRRRERRKRSHELTATVERKEKILQLLINKLNEIIKKFQKRLKKTLTINYNPNYEKLKKKIEDYLKIDGLGLRSKKKNDREGKGGGEVQLLPKRDN